LLNISHSQRRKGKQEHVMMKIQFRNEREKYMVSEHGEGIDFIFNISKKKIYDRFQCFSVSKNFRERPL
jgi:hypothetical protein